MNKLKRYKKKKKKENRILKNKAYTFFRLCNAHLKSIMKEGK